MSTTGRVAIVILSGLLILGIISALNPFPQEKVSFTTLFPNNFQDSQFIVSNAGENRLESPDLCLIQGTTLIGTSPTNIISSQVLGSVIGSIEQEANGRKEIIEIVVEKGDNLSSIAKQYNVTLETLLSANDMEQGSVIQPGQKLIILPISGIMHIVEQGNTIGGIVQTYKGDIEEVVVFNNLSENGEIFIGDIIVIPGGKLPVKPILAQYAPLATSYFICPISAPCRITQGLHWYNAIDFSNGKCNEMVFAAAGGVVQKVSYSGIGGRYIRILHTNGMVTYYGHLSKALVIPGQKVSQGTIIGYTGYTGYTIPSGPAGCHLHFDLLTKGVLNPFAR